LDDDQIIAYVAQALGIKMRPARVMRLGGRQGMVVARVAFDGRGSWVFKAVRRADQREVALAAAVAGFSGGRTPAVYGCEVDEPRGVSWIVMQDVGDLRLRDQPDADAFAAAADALAAIQIAALSHLDDPALASVPRLGVSQWEDVALEVLDQVGSAAPQASRAGLEDAAWAAGEAASVTATLPVSLVHGDLHTGNVAIRECGGPCLLDWGSAYLAAAFFGFEELAVASGGRMLVPEIEGRARAAYLRRWAPLLGKPGPLARPLLACRLLLRLEVARQALRRLEDGREAQFDAAAACRLASDALRQWRKASGTGS